MIRPLIAAIAAITSIGMFARADDMGRLPPSFSTERSVPESGVIRFDVLRQGSEFGTHVLRFEQDDDAIRVTTDVDLKVSFGPFVPFRYQLDVEEVWRGGRLESLSGTTIDNGDEYTVEATREGDVIRVDGTKFSGTVPFDTPTTGWWNAALLDDAELISTEDGALTPIRVENLGRETIEARFGSLEATRFRIESSLTLDLWYDDEGHWVKCAFEARGQKIEYVLAEPVTGS